jgi:hypothetical protein
MMATGHMLTGSVLCGAIAPLLPAPAVLAHPSAAMLAGIVVGAPLALLMDLDTRGTACRLLGPIGWLLRPALVGLAKFVFDLTRGPGDPKETSGHRMLTHQVEFAGVLALIAFVATAGTGWEWWTAGMVFIGVWAHRAGDACTKSGVPVSLTRVLVRAARGERQRWLRTGMPAPLRFVTGGRRGARRWGARLDRLWDRVGESVVCGLLSVVLGGQLAWALHGF